MGLLEQQICAFISAELLDGLEVASDDELLLSDLVDSLGVMRLIAHLEDRYAITIPPQDVILETMQTADAIARYLRASHGVSEPVAP